MSGRVQTMRIAAFLGCVLMPMCVCAAPPVLIAQLSSSDGVQYSGFGSAVSLSGNNVIVGSPGQKLAVGSAYIFRGSQSGWTQEIELWPDDLTHSGQFGTAVAMSGDVVMVSSGVTGEGGAVFVFSRVDGQWVFVQRLVSGDPPGGYLNPCFGCSIALAGGTALIGAPNKMVGSNLQQGVVYAFNFDGASWMRAQEFTSSDGASGDTFGTVAMSGSTALIGAPKKSFDTGVAMGSIYIFTLTDGIWIQRQALRASDGQSDDFFGAAVALSGTTAAAGSTLHKVGANTAQGQVYTFSSNAGVWTQQQRVKASDGAADDQFGASIALTDDTLIVGAVGKKSSASKLGGVVYTFTKSADRWNQFQEITGRDSAGGTDFGSCVAVQGGTAVIGANGANVGQIMPQGAAYIFDRMGDGVFQNGFDVE